MTTNTSLRVLCCLLVLVVGACDTTEPRLESGEQVLILGGTTLDGGEPVDPFIVDVGLERVVEQGAMIRMAGRLLAISPDGEELYYVPHSEPREIAVLDLATRSIVRRRPLDELVGGDRGALFGIGSAVSPDGRYLFISKWHRGAEGGSRGSGIGVVDAQTLEVAGVIEELAPGWPMTAVPPSARYPQGALAAIVATDPTAADADRTWALAIIDPVEHKAAVMHTLAIPHPGGNLVAVPEGDAVILDDAYALRRIELGDGAVSRSIDLPTPGHLVLRPDGSRLYRSQFSDDVRGNYTQGRIDVFDLELDALPAIDLSDRPFDGSRPNMLSMAFGADGTTLNVVIGTGHRRLPAGPVQQGRLLVIDTDTHALTKVVPLGVYSPRFPVVLP